jgi:hypothetical protein
MANHPNRASIKVFATSQGLYSVTVGGRQTAKIANNGLGRWLLYETNMVGEAINDLRRDVTSVLHSDEELKVAIREFFAGIVTPARRAKRSAD